MIGSSNFKLTYIRVALLLFFKHFTSKNIRSKIDFEKRTTKDKMDKIVNWGTNSSIHGISHFVLSGNRSFKNRYFWLTVFTAFTTICLYLQVSLLYQIFVEKPTIVDVFHTRENYLNFPNVVVCDMNQKHDKVIEYFKAYGNGSRMTEFVVQMSKNNLYEVVRRQFRNDTSWASEIHPILTKQYAEAWAAMIPPWADIFSKSFCF